MKFALRRTLTFAAIATAVVFVAFAIVALTNPGASRTSLAFIALGIVVCITVALYLQTRAFDASLASLHQSALAIASGTHTHSFEPPPNAEVAQITAVLGNIAELTSLNSMALRAEQALLRAITESLNEGVVVVNVRSQVVRINETARQLLRLKEAVPFPTDYLPRDRTLRGLLDVALSGHDAAPTETRVDDRTLSVTARPLIGGGAVLALYDLTPFRRLEAVRRDFVANVSHELRTPLTIISGFVETLQDDDIPLDLRHQFLGMASGNVRRMQRIVDDLLDLSRIESGGWLPNPIEMDLQPLVNEIIVALRATHSTKAVQLESAIHAGAPIAFVDSTAIRQILTNLSENALRHTNTGSVQLFSEREDNGVWIGVRDTGSGIGTEHLSRIFERFYRADPSRSREAGGTGLGLSIVKHLADAHGGKVRAVSSLGRGTSIAAWFPNAE